MGRRDIVSIDKFGKFLENFGPLYKTTARLGRSKKKRTITAFNRVFFCFWILPQFILINYGVIIF